MQKPVLFMMFGYPGAGKTTASQLISEMTGAVHLSSDALRLEMFSNPTYSQEEHDALYTELNKRTEALLREGKSVVYDANLNRYVHRLEKYELSERTGAKPVLVWVQAPKDLARKRAVMRGYRHLVPKDETFESMFERVASAIEEPREDEPVYTISGNPIDKKALTEIISRL
ncbi:ATP-binding protein [Candidatus Saccharibacteria bacterium]|nr:ATP-binding protein [Candidatus Saccharibacteria bacterium]